MTPATGFQIPHSPELTTSRQAARRPLTLAGTKLFRFGVPAERYLRERVRQEARRQVRRHQLVPPLSLDELAPHADAVVRRSGISPAARHFAAVLVANAAWEDVVAGIPMERRMLLLPQCLRRRRECPARMDALGLLCEGCGRCPTGSIEDEADRLGLPVLVAEGTTVVTRLLENGQVDAVIGVGCLEALERSFPLMAAGAIPGLAIPLYRDGCDDTRVDVDWIQDAMHLHTDARPVVDTPRLEVLKAETDALFQAAAVSDSLLLHDTHPEQVACEWMLGGGKRWRPLLAIGVYRAIAGSALPLPDSIKKLALAVECFHKASLAHDDIEDGDALRYGQPTLHARHGLPVALNAGDLLVGEGYRMIAESGVQPALLARMLAVAARGHRDLCLGQGEELRWTRNPGPLSVGQVLEIARRKTAPAFEVALTLGALCAGAGEELCRWLHEFSEALGIAYQIHDDIEDFLGDPMRNDLTGRRPSMVLAMALEGVERGGCEELAASLREGCLPGASRLLENTEPSSRLVERAAWMLSDYRLQVNQILARSKQHPLKRLLTQLVFRILGPEATLAPADHSAPPPSLQAGPGRDREEVAHAG